MQKICERLQDKNRLKTFLSKTIFDGEEVQFLTVFVEDSNIYVIYFKDLVDILTDNFTIENSKARQKNQF